VGNYEPTGWGRKSPTYDFKVPSGQTCLLRRPKIEDLLAVGMLDNIDQLTQIASKNISKTETGKEESATVPEEMRDPKTLGTIFGAVEKIVQYVVVRPRILDDPNCASCGREMEWHFTPEANHEFEFPDPGDAVYQSWVDLSDKIAIITEVTGPINQLAPFPREQAEGVESVEPSEVVSSNSESITTS
jgi:hypothetical protein